MSKNVSDEDKACRVLLRSVSNKIDSIGVASVQLQPAKFTIIGIDLPDPQEFDSKYTKYMGWIVDNETRNKIGVELTMTIRGIWIGEGTSDLLAEFDEVLITPEEDIAPLSPTGPTVLIGLLSSCFMY